MAQLWGGRFTKETDKLVYNFNASISFDQKFYEQDIRGSKAHVAMLARQGILTSEEKDQIEAGLDGILADVRSGKLEITSEYEDHRLFTLSRATANEAHHLLGFLRFSELENGVLFSTIHPKNNALEFDSHRPPH